MYNINGKIGGEYKLAIIEKDGTVRHPIGTEWRKNLVLNAGLDMIFNGDYPANASGDNSFTGLMAYARVGTGNSSPINSQRQLDNQVLSCGVYRNFAPNNVNGTSYDTTNGAATFTRSYNFDVALVNRNLNEIGFSNKASSVEDLFSRVVLPVTVTVLTGEQLVITYRLKVTVAQVITGTAVAVSGGGWNGAGTLKLVGEMLFIFGGVDANGNFLPNSSASGLRGRLAYGSASLATNSTFPAVNTNAAKSYCGVSRPDSTGGIVASVYNIDDYFRDFVATIPLNIPVSSVSNIRSVYFWTFLTSPNDSTGGIQWLLDNDQPKGTSLTLTFTYRIAWAR